MCKMSAEFSRKLLIFQTDLLLNLFEIAAVQKYANRVELEKCCQTHILNYYFPAKFRFDKAEIEPANNLQKICKCC